MASGSRFSPSRGKWRSKSHSWSASCIASVLRHATLEEGLGVILANKLQTPDLPAILLRDLINDALTHDVPIRARFAPISWRRERETRRPMATRSRFCITRDFTRCRPTESHTGCGDKDGTCWPRISRIASRRHLASTSIRRLSWAPESSSIMARASSSVRPRSWKTMSRCCTKSRSAAPAKSGRPAPEGATRRAHRRGREDPGQY